MSEEDRSYRYTRLEDSKSRKGKSNKKKVSVEASSSSSMRSTSETQYESSLISSPSRSNITSKSESKKKSAAQIVEQDVVEQQLQELLPAICVFNSSAVKGDKASLEGGEESRLLEYKVSKKWFGFGSLRLRSGFFPTKDKLDMVFPSIEASVKAFNKRWHLKNAVVLKTRKITERHYIEVKNLSKEILKKFPQAQDAFLQFHKNAQSQNSIHPYLEEQYLKEGDLSWGLAAIKDLVIQDLGEDNDKVNEIKDGCSPLQRALSCLLTIKCPSSTEHEIFFSPARAEVVGGYLRRVIQTLLSVPNLQITPIAGEGSPLEMAKKLGNSEDDRELVEAITEQMAAVNWKAPQKTTSLSTSSNSSAQSNLPQSSGTSSYIAPRKSESGENLQQAPVDGFFPKVEAKPVVLRKNSGDTTADVNEQPTTVGIVANGIPASAWR